MIKNISFCILDYGQAKESLRRCIDSIRSQDVPEREILVCGAGGKACDVKYFCKEDWTKQGAINKVRNFLCSHASQEFIALIDSNIKLSPDWYKNIRDADCYEIIGSRLINSNNERVIDWAYQFKLAKQNFPQPLQYDEWTTKAYVSGVLMLVQYSVWERVKFNENLFWGQAGDVDFCLRASEIGFRLGVFPKATAVYYLGRNEYKPRYVTFKESLRIVAGFRDVLSKTETAFASGDYNQAIKYYQKVIEMAPEEETVLGKIGWAYYFIAEYDNAIKMFDKAIRLNPKNSYALRGRGWSYSQKGSYEEAIRDLFITLEYTPIANKGDWYEASRGLAWAYYHKGIFEEAIQSFNKILENTPSSETGILQDVFRGLGWTYYRSGNFQEAIESFNKALENIGSNNKEILQEVKQGIELAYEGRGDKQECKIITVPTLLTDIPEMQSNKIGLASKIKRKLKNLWA